MNCVNKRFFHEEKLIAISELFDISLDELMLGKTGTASANSADAEKSLHKDIALINVLEEKMLTTENKRKARKTLKIAGIIAGIIIVVDLISMIIYFGMYGIPK